MEELFDKEFAKQQIEDIYGSIVNFAREMGVSNQTIHNKLSRPSDKFIRQLSSRGIMANKAQVGNNNNYSDTNDRLIKVLERLVKSQELSLESQRSTVELQQHSLMEKNKIISDLQKEVSTLRKELEKRE